MDPLSDKLAQPTHQESITSIFKMRCLNLTLKFVKDDTRMSIEFKDLTVHQAVFIQRLINNTDIDPNVGFGYKSLYAPLWEALKTFGLKYEYRIKISNSEGDKKCLNLQKIPKQLAENTHRPLSGRAPDHVTKETPKVGPPTHGAAQMGQTQLQEKKTPTAIISPKQESVQIKTKLPPACADPCLGPQRSLPTVAKTVEPVKNNLQPTANNVIKPPDFIMSQKIKGLQKSKMYLNNLTKIFVKSSLDKMYHFYKDESQSRIMFKGVNKYETYYLVTFKNLLNSSVLQACFDNNTKALFHEIKAVVPSKSRFNIRIRIVNSYPGQISDVMFIKYTVAEDSKQDTLKLDEPKVEPQSNKSPPPAATNVSSSDSKSTRPVTTASATVPVHTNASENLNIISFQSGGILDLKKGENKDSKVLDTAKSDTNGRTVVSKNMQLSVKENGNTTPSKQAMERRLPYRKVKLLEDMSVPLKCDKALKMMQDMGWQGGALGVRGEGIVEPIMPVLDMVSRAGLGHERLPKKPKEKGPNNQGNPHERIVIMESLLDLVSSHVEFTTLSFESPMSAQTLKFIKSSLTKLGSRSMDAWRKEVSHIAGIAVEVMRRTPDLFLRADISADCRKVNFSKMYVDAFGGNVSNADVQMIERRAHMQHLLAPIVGPDIENVLDDLAAASQSKKSYNSLQFRIENLLFVLEFVQSYRMSAVRAFNDIIVKKHLDFLRSLVEAVNRGEMYGPTMTEKNLSMLIHYNKGNWHLMVEFNYNYKEYAVRKIYGPPDCNENAAPIAHPTKLPQDNKTLRKYDGPRIRITNGDRSSVTDAVKEVKAKPNADDADSPDVTIIETIESPIVISDDDDDDNKELLNACSEKSIECIVISDDDDDIESMKARSEKNADCDGIANSDGKETLNANSEKKNYYDDLPDYDDLMETLNARSEKNTDCGGTAYQYDEKELLNASSEKNTDCDGVAEQYDGKELLNASSEKNTDCDGVAEQYDGKELLNASSEKNTDCDGVAEQYDGKELLNASSEKNTDCDGIADHDDDIESLSALNEKNTGRIEIADGNDRMETLNARSERNTECNQIADHDDGTKILNARSEKNTDRIEIADGNDLIETLNARGDKNTDCKADINGTLPSKAQVIEISIANTLEDIPAQTKSADDSNLSSKRCRSNSCSPEMKIIKKSKRDRTKVCIAPIDYPNNLITTAQAQTVQKLISCNIDISRVLPLLKCHGIVDGALVYSCHTKESLLWLENTLSVVSDVKILDTEEDDEDTYKLALKFNCCFDFDIYYLLDKLELYNSTLSTSKWVILEESSSGDSFQFIVNVDKDSYNYIRESGFSLYAGVDQAQFIIVSD